MNRMFKSIYYILLTSFVVSCVRYVEPTSGDIAKVRFERGAEVYTSLKKKNCIDNCFAFRSIKFEGRTGKKRLDIPMKINGTSTKEVYMEANIENYFKMRGRYNESKVKIYIYNPNTKKVEPYTSTVYDTCETPIFSYFFAKDSAYEIVYALDYIGKKPICFVKIFEIFKNSNGSFTKKALQYKTFTQ